MSSSDGWVQRLSWETTMPADLMRGQPVEYRLEGDGGVYDGEAGGLFWGQPAPGDLGRIVAYRPVRLTLAEPARKHGHYFKSVAHLNRVDVYRTLELFGVTDPCLQHALKKLLVAGGRGAGKDIRQDVKEAIDSLQRWQEMRAEDEQRVRSA